MHYREPHVFDTAQVQEILAADHVGDLCELIVSLSLNDREETALEVIWLLGAHQSWEVRALCATGLGHLARRYRRLDGRSMALLKSLQSDARTASYAADALGDVQMFAGHS